MDTKWNMTTPAEAGFAPDLDENFEIARQAGTLPNLHSVIAAARRSYILRAVSRRSRRGAESIGSYTVRA